MDKKHKKRRIGWWMFLLIAAAALAAALLVLMPQQPRYSDADGDTVTILFTHDMHDHYEAHSVAGADQALGGYARLATAVKSNQSESSVYVDAGDFSMGSVIQTVFETDAPSLRILGLLGCDATTLGNHEFDYGSDALANALCAASESGAKLPNLLIANLDDVTAETGTALSDALHAYGAAQYTLIERGGVKIGIFGIVGQGAMSSAYRATTTFSGEVKAARACVKALRAEGAELIVCISHSGTSSFTLASADENLARRVDGIDVIVSGHSHTLLEKPLCVNGTLIVSCGQNAEHLGSLTVVRDGDGWAVKAYSLIAIDDRFCEDEEMLALINAMLCRVDEQYMSHFGYAVGDVIAQTSFDFSTGLPYANNHYNEPLGQFVCDAERYAIRRAEGDAFEEIDVSLVIDSAIRGSIDKGDVTASELYAVRGIGYGSDGFSGDPLATFYLTGRELRYLCECDASIADFAPAIQIYMTGIAYTYSSKSLPLDRVADVYLIKNGVQTPLEDDRLYRVSTCLYNLNMFGIAGSYTAGLITIVPKNADGSAIEDFNTAVVLTKIDGEDRELKEWLALIQYAASFPAGAAGTPQIDGRYNGLFTERTELSRANLGGYFVLVAALVVLAAVIAGIVCLCRRHRRKKRLSRKQK